MVRTKTPVPENGFMRLMRRVMAIICAVLFVGSVVGDALGWLENAVPLRVQFALLACSLMMFEAVNEFIKKVTGGK